MSSKTLAQKLFLKPGKSLLLYQAPSDMASLEELHPFTKDEAGQKDVILAFLNSMAEVKKELGRLKALLVPGGALWVAYLKGNKIDFNRDSLAAAGAEVGLQPCAMFSIDSQWSALRFKQA